MAFDAERVHAIAERVAASSGLEVVEVELRGGGKSRMLRVFLDKPAGVTHEDCAQFSREFGTILDVEDVVPGAYTLEVSSPGLDRPLIRPDDYRRFAGRRAKLVMREAVDGQTFFKGTLGGVEEGHVIIDAEDRRTHRVPLAMITRANLEVEF